MEKIDTVLKFWFGRVEKTVIPSERRARIWFGESKEVDEEIKQEFSKDLESAIQYNYQEWENNPRGQLALIILLDQFSRHVYRDTPKAFAQDEYALEICIHGIQNKADHHLSLIERVFYYFPLLHAENIACQKQSVHAYQNLVDLAFPETHIIYDSFLQFAQHHFGIIERFGRFPQRNMVLGRDTIPSEEQFLKQADEAQKS